MNRNYHAVPSALRERPIKHGIRIATAVVFSATWLLPIIGVLFASIRPYGEIVNGWWRFDEFHVTLKNYLYVLSGTSIPMVRPMLNSLFSSILGAFLPALFGSMTAYAFARHRIPGKTVLTVVFLCLMAIPGQMIAIPAFRRINAIGLLDTYLGVILMNTVTALPWIIFFMMNVIKGQNISLEEAAKIDGASEYRIFANIIVPQSAPALVSLFILQFVWSWNSFFWPLIIIFNPKKMMATQVIPMLRGQFYTNWGALSGAALLVMIIPIIVFLVFQRLYIQGSVGFVGEKE